MKYKHTKQIKKEDLKSLYENAGWSGYTNDMNKLVRAVANSNTVISAWENEKLVGLVRTISDNETIVYIQDILVLKSYKRKGIGKKFIEMILEESKNIRQIILLTEAEDKVARGFYENLNFKSCNGNDIEVAFKYIGK